VDTKRIGLWGGSYAANLTALGLGAGVPSFSRRGSGSATAVHDWRTERRCSCRPTITAVQQEALRLALDSSPMAHIQGWRSAGPFLVHGDDDPDVAFGQTVQLVEALRRKGVEFEQLVFPDEVHDFLTHARWLRPFRAAAAFLDQHLSAPAALDRANRPRSRPKASAKFRTRRTGNFYIVLSRPGAQISRGPGKEIPAAQ